MTARRSPLTPGASESRDRAANPVGDAAQPSAPADHREAARGQDDVDALASKVPGLVEPVLLGTRLYDLDDRAQEGSLRRRASCREVEPRPLARSLATEAQHAHGHADLERASPARTGHLEQARGRPGRSPTEARCGRARRGGRCPTTSRRRGAQPPGLRGGRDALRVRRRRARPPPRERVTTMPAQRESFRDRRTERRQEGEAPGSASQPHRSTRSRSSSSVAGPIPGTASSSSTDPNAPCSDR